ncbi:MAG: cell division protein FtsZ, partial [Flavobacteriales bacterium]
RTVMQGAGAAVMGSATCSGENRATRAAQDAISSPLLNNTDISGAKYILLNILAGDAESFTMDEMGEITEFVQGKAGESAEIIFGMAYDESLEDKVSVTLIATGFESSQKPESVKVEVTNKEVVEEEEAVQENPTPEEVVEEIVEETPIVESKEQQEEKPVVTKKRTPYRWPRTGLPM